MPRLDQSGPKGEGKLTGRGMGRCQENSQINESGLGQGLGRGRGQARKCGTMSMRRKNGNCMGFRQRRNVGFNDDKEILQVRKAVLEKELKDIDIQLQDR
ncbi:DUF5320 domain-containing protein [Peptostreptococcaceae bacterium AGR-M142]